MPLYASDFGFQVPPHRPLVDDLVETFEGFRIGKDDSGFYWFEGGYFVTIQECRNDVHDKNADPSYWA